MSLPRQMTAAVLTGHGGLDRLVVRDDVPVPTPGPGEVLLEVGAAGVNNTDINTRVGWYSKAVTDGTTSDGGTDGFGDADEGDATWSGSPLQFPRIQGADMAGRIAAVGSGVDSDRIGERVIVDPVVRDPADPENRKKAQYLGSERDGGFAQYVAIPAENAYRIQTDLTDAELASFPCSYHTAEHMLTRIRLAEGETILIPGASGGVGSALVQLAVRRGAKVLAVSSAGKREPVQALGDIVVLDRSDPDLEKIIRKHTPDGELDAVADIVGGAAFPILLDLLKIGGRYVTSGAIAGPIVELDLRTLYLKDLEMQGATIAPAFVFKNLVEYIEKGEIRPLVAKIFSIQDIRKAQTAFIEKRYVGKLAVEIKP